MFQTDADHLPHMQTQHLYFACHKIFEKGTKHNAKIRSMHYQLS